jgi:hypothetical protein
VPKYDARNQKNKNALLLCKRTKAGQKKLYTHAKTDFGKTKTTRQKRKLVARAEQSRAEQSRAEQSLIR